MNIKIKKLTPALAEDYIRFFDETPHNNGVDSPCYCVSWRSDDSFASDGHWFPTREDRREKAKKFVLEGSIKGYLAYIDGKVAGWCNTNENCRIGIDHLRNYYPIEEHAPGTKVKPIFCFVVKPEMQRQGIATMLVEHICIDAAEEGFDFVEAYVNSKFVDNVSDFRGPMEMYEKCGFVKVAELDGKAVMRKILK